METLQVTLVVAGIVVVLALVVLLAIHSKKLEQQRIDAIRAWAKGRGLRFDQPRSDAIPEPLVKQSSFGFDRRILNTSRGSLTINRRAHGVITGDFTYKTESRDSKGRRKVHHHRWSYLIVESPYRGLPALTVRGENFFDKIGAAIGFDDIDFEDRQFSKAYHVTCEDRRFAYDLFHPRMIEWWNERERDAPWITMERGVLFVRRGWRWKPEEFEAMLTWAEAFIDRWPDHMLAELEGDSSFRTGITTDEETTGLS
jgi:hypothetical protein